jgi:hypothetical protein
MVQSLLAAEFRLIREKRMMAVVREEVRTHPSGKSNISLGSAIVGEAACT